jgi:hypothetical protein
MPRPSNIGRLAWLVFFWGGVAVTMVTCLAMSLFCEITNQEFLPPLGIALATVGPFMTLSAVGCRAILDFLRN